MRGVQRTHGFTLIEIAIVVAIVSFMVALAAPRFMAYQRRQDARAMVQRVNDVITNARSEAIRRGNNQLLLFDVPAAGLIRVVDDVNDDWLVTGGEATRDINLLSNLDVSVSRWITGGPTAIATPEDGGGPLPANGTTFPIDGATTAPAVAFTSRGLPVSLPAGGLGSGAGSYYVTDNDTLVYAVTLLPLGGTRVRIFRPQLTDWF